MAEKGAGQGEKVQGSDSGNRSGRACPSRETIYLHSSAERQAPQPSGHKTYSRPASRTGKRATRRRNAPSRLNKKIAGKQRIRRSKKHKLNKKRIAWATTPTNGVGTARLGKCTGRLCAGIRRMRREIAQNPKKYGATGKREAREEGEWTTRRHFQMDLSESYQQHAAGSGRRRAAAAIHP